MPQKQKNAVWLSKKFCNTDILHPNSPDSKLFKLTKERSRRYPAKTITDASYADDIALLANAPAQAESLLHSLERAAADIGFHIIVHKTEYMCFNQTGDISTLNDCSLKLVHKFTYIGSSVSSTETDINTRLAKAETTNDSLSVTWKSDLTEWNKTQFLPSSSRVDTAVWMHYMDANQTYREKALLQLHKNAASNIEHVLDTISQKAAAVRPPTTHHENYQN